jgi:hypothetical protein
MALLAFERLDNLGMKVPPESKRNRFRTFLQRPDFEAKNTQRQQPSNYF